jgi:hypothetical protein
MTAQQHLLVATGTATAVATQEHTVQIIAVVVQIITLLLGLFKKPKQ